MEYITTDGVVRLNDGILKIKTFHREPPVRFYLFLIVMIYLYDRFFESPEVSSKPWVLLGIISVYIIFFVSFHLTRLFRGIPGKSILISKIATIKIEKEDRYVTNMRITLDSGRFRIIEFRTLENEYRALANNIKEINPTVTING